MPGPFTPENTLARLKKDAKHWLKALRAGDREARERFARAVPNAPTALTLRDVQHAVARELGFTGWTVLKRELAADPPAPDSLEARVNRFLEAACPDHHVRGLPDHRRAQHTAMRLLERHPEIARANVHTAVVCGDFAAVKRALAERPELASTKSEGPSPYRAMAGGSGDLFHDMGPKGWEPLLYLCFTRLPVAAATDNAVAIAHLLLDHGADPNVYFMADASRYTPLVGAIGEGEENRPPHPRRNELVSLLLDRGAGPYDNQVLYNMGFHGDYLWYLLLIHDRSLRLGREADWGDPEWRMLNMGCYGTGARWLLERAIRNNDLALAEWCLAHGANPDSPPAADPRFPQLTLYETAVKLGSHEMADLLVRHGATRTDVRIRGIDAFTTACLRLDRDAVRAAVDAHPEYLHAHEPLFAAAKANRADVVAMVLDLGMSPDVENAAKERPLHVAAYNNAVQAAEVLVARGAEIDPVEGNWNNTPLGAATYYHQQAMIDLLGPLSRDVWELTYLGKVDRLREVFAETPERARVTWNGWTPLMCLPPEDERLALEIVKLFLERGADPTVVNKEGTTAADRAEKLGMFEVASYLRRVQTTR